MTKKMEIKNHNFVVKDYKIISNASAIGGPLTISIPDANEIGRGRFLAHIVEPDVVIEVTNINTKDGKLYITNRFGAKHIPSGSILRIDLKLTKEVKEPNFVTRDYKIISGTTSTGGILTISISDADEIGRGKHLARIIETGETIQFTNINAKDGKLYIMHFNEPKDIPSGSTLHIHFYQNDREKKPMKIDKFLDNHKEWEDSKPKRPRLEFKSDNGLLMGSIEIDEGELVIFSDHRKHEDITFDFSDAIKIRDFFNEWFDDKE